MNAVFAATVPSSAEFLTSGPFWVAVIVAIISLGQWLTARDKLRFDLYEKRFKIYQEVLEFIAAAWCDTVSPDVIARFDVARREAYFLFGQDRKIVDYLNLVRQKAEERSTLKSQASEIEGPRNPERTSRVNDITEIINWFSQQREVAQQIFSGYMSFKK